MEKKGSGVLKIKLKNYYPSIPFSCTYINGFDCRYVRNFRRDQRFNLCNTSCKQPYFTTEDQECCLGLRTENCRCEAVDNYCFVERDGVLIGEVC